MKRNSMSSIKTRLNRFWITAALVFFGITCAHATVSLRVVADRAPIDTTPIQAYVTVTDANGPVGGLTANNFTVLEDNRTTTAPVFTLPPISGTAAVSLVFVMDYSNSVAASKSSIEAAVTNIVDNHMLSDDFGAIVKFNTAAQLITPPGFTANKADLKTAISAAYPTSVPGTALYDAIMLGLRGFDTATLPAGPRALILLSDGKETNQSTATYNDVLAKIKASSIPIFTIAFGSTPKTATLQALADASHGISYVSADAAALQEIYQTIADELQNEYLLSYSSATTDCNPHTLTVQVDSPTAQSATVSFQRCTPAVASSGGGAIDALDSVMLVALGALSWRRRRLETAKSRTR